MERLEKELNEQRQNDADKAVALERQKQKTLRLEEELTALRKKMKTVTDRGASDPLLEEEVRILKVGLL